MHDYDIRRNIHSEDYKEPEVQSSSSVFFKDNRPRWPQHLHSHRSFSLPHQWLRNKRDQLPAEDELDFNDDILNLSDEMLQEYVQADARNFAEALSEDSSSDGNVDEEEDYISKIPEEVNNAFSRELERIFAIGVRSLLTTYMQKSLQPAIKKTLMENMGYTVSYG